MSGTITLSSTNKPVYTGEFPSVAVEQYFSTVYTLSQQRETKLGGHVRRETLKGRYAHFPIIKPVSSSEGVKETTAGSGLASGNQTTGNEPVEVTARWGATQWSLTEWAERRVTARRWDWSHPFEQDDLDRTLMNPQGPATREALSDYNRNVDEVIIGAALGDALEVQRDSNGDESSTTVSFGTGVTDSAVVDPGGANLMSLDKLRFAKRLMVKGEVDMNETPVLVISGDEEYSLLGENRVVSQDYSSQTPLIQGRMINFYGCNIIVSERLPEAGGVRDCFLYMPSGMIMAIEDEMFWDFGPRRDKKVVDQVYMKQRFGCTRMEEVKVIKIQCKTV